MEHANLMAECEVLQNLVEPNGPRKIEIYGRDSLLKSRFARDTHLLLRRIFSPRGLDALQNRKAQEYNCTHCDPTRGDMQYHGSID